MEQKKEYTAPQLELIACRIEKGFTGSGTRSLALEGNDEQVENYSLHGTWNNGSNFFD